MTKMVDISGKDHVNRSAVAEGSIRLQKQAMEKIKEKEVPKGDVLPVAQTAAVLAVKNTPDIVPLTHPIPISGVEVDFEFKENVLKVRVKVKSEGQTGVEMEALTGVMASLLVVWDMVKEFEKDEEGQYPNTKIEDIKILEKVKE